MAHDVFISYSMKDKAVADAVCATLESRKVRCWIAPRDAEVGVFYAESIVDAISSSRIMVLVLSSSSNDSAHVTREVERAASGGTLVIPFRIEDVALSKSLQYFIGPVHWLDAITLPLEKHMNGLADYVEQLLKRVASVPKPGFTPPAPAAEPAPPIPSAQPTPAPQPLPQPGPMPPPRPAPPPHVALGQLVGGVASGGAVRAVLAAGIGAVAGGLASFAALAVHRTIDAPVALVTFLIAGGAIAGAVTWCWLRGAAHTPTRAAMLGAIGGLAIGGAIEWGATYAFAISAGDARSWAIASALLWCAYGYAGGRALDRGQGLALGLDSVRVLLAVSAIRFLAIGLLETEWVWIVWLHDALLAIGWRLGLAISGAMRPAAAPPAAAQPTSAGGGSA